MDKHTLLTYEKPKYAEQIVAILSDGGGSGLRLFDAVDLFMEDDGFATRQAVFESGEAKTFATEFVERFNSHASLLSTIKELVEACEKALTLCDLVSRADMALEGCVIEKSVRESLTRAKSLMEQKP